MNKRLTLLLIFLFCFEGMQAQYSTAYQESQLRQITAEEIESQIDSASAETFTPLHARYFKLVELQAGEGEEPIWTFEKNDTYLSIVVKELALNFGDTLFIGNSSDPKAEFITQANNIQNSFKSAYYLDDIKLSLNRTGSFPFSIDGLSLSPKRFSSVVDFGDSAPCELNVNCSEGDNFRDVQKSVVRIEFLVAGFNGWCTGTLINNTNCDRSPFIYTAEHCAYVQTSFASPEDFESWRFYFNYEGESCTNPASESEVNFSQITGAELLARSDDNGGDEGSDFLLLRLTNLQAFNNLGNVYFAGWNRTNLAPEEGVTIHHPQGDIKKISTFKNTAISSTFRNVPNTHWRVTWSATANGLGVTEAGSSGAPLIDRNSLITGALTGGLATCSGQNKEDLYGKFSYSWDQNGTDPINQLETWLDPAGTGREFFPGVYKNDTSSCAAAPSETLITTITGSGFLNITTDGTSTATVQIFSLNGRLVKEDEFIPFPNIAQPIDVSNLRGGIYLLRLITSSQTEIRKVFIVNP